MLYTFAVSFEYEGGGTDCRYVQAHDEREARRKFAARYSDRRIYAIDLCRPLWLMRNAQALARDMIH